MAAPCGGPAIQGHDGRWQSTGMLERIGLTLAALGNGQHRNGSAAPRPGPPPASKRPPPKTYPTARAAVDSLERRHGRRSAAWTYHNAAADPVGLVVRWDPPGDDKFYRPVSRNGSGWLVAGMPKLRPLYRLPELPPAARVFVTEGEKAADAARSLGHTATTSADPLYGCSSYIV